MQLESITQKPSSNMFSIIAAICYGLFVYGVYQFSEYEASMLNYAHYQSTYVYLFAGALLVGYGAYLFAVHKFKLHPVVIPTAAILTLFFGNSIFLYVVSEVAILVFSSVALIITLLHFSLAKDAGFAAMLLCVLNGAIFFELSITIHLGLQILIGSVVVLIALHKKWRITHHLFLFVLSTSGLVYFLGALIERDYLLLVLCVLFGVLYSWTYRRMMATQ